jgi:hypothetical protein
LLREAEGVADVLDAAGDANAPTQVRLGGLWAWRAVAVAGGGFFDEALEDGADRDASGQGILRRLKVAFAVEVAAA